MDFEKLGLSVVNPRQILNMGGPWVGTLVAQKLPFSCDNIIIDNVLLDSPRHRILFAKYHRVSKWNDDNYFTIDLLDLKAWRQMESVKHLKMVYLSRMIGDNLLEYFEAFNDADVSKRRVQELNYSEFILIN